MSLSVANHHASLPVAYRLYLPEDWAADSKRRRKTGVPEDVVFKTKPEIALEQIAAACKAGLPRGVVLMDAGYGCNTDLRTGVSALGLRYVAGILPITASRLLTSAMSASAEPAPRDGRCAGAATIPRRRRPARRCCHLAATGRDQAARVSPLGRRRRRIDATTIRESCVGSRPAILDAGSRPRRAGTLVDDLAVQLLAAQFVPA